MNRKKKEKAVRNKQIHFVVSEEEEILIKQKIENLGITNVSAYFRKMIMDGYVIQLDLSDVKETIRLLRIYNNNLNQYAKKANETGSIYKEDIQELKRKQEELWKLMKGILNKLSNI